ncbi:hypothetical protein V1524DRAFT_420568 [Lipomyces starkeyi]
MSDVFAQIGLTDLFEACTASSAFIQQLAAVQIPDSAFNEWLFQDFIFVRAFAHFLASTISSVPNDQKFAFLSDTLRGGFDVLTEEMRIFKEKAGDRGVALPELQPFSASLEAELAVDGAQLLTGLRQDIPKFSQFNSAYCTFLAVDLGAKSSSTFAERIAVLWAAEIVYLTAFKFVLSSEKFQADAGESLKGFMEWWGGNPAFDAYVETLSVAVRLVLETETEDGKEIVKRSIEKVLDLEVQFWDGSLSAAE